MLGVHAEARRPPLLTSNTKNAPSTVLLRKQGARGSAPAGGCGAVVEGGPAGAAARVHDLTGRGAE